MEMGSRNSAAIAIFKQIMNIYTSATDGSTNDVIDWIYFLAPDQVIRRFNDYQIPQQFSIHISKERLNLDKSWYRRGNIYLTNNKRNNQDQDVATIREKYGTENQFVYEAFLDQIFDPLNSINAVKDNNTNKIINLRRAVSKEIEVPETLVSNELNEINGFLKDDQQYIIKDVALDPINITRNDINFSIRLLPQKLSGKAIKAHLNLSPSNSREFLFIQEYIEKKVELRIFFIRDKIYGMAIFSQNNERTRTDYRNYDTELPNRCVPFRIPRQLEAKVQSLMTEIGINCGSIDMIYTPDKRFVFLEVNPIGQFQWLARNCNYDIEREIAQFLLA